MHLETLKKRREFLRVRGGARWSTPAFLIEGRQRTADAMQHNGMQCIAERARGPRFGFTITKKLGNAVRRNRIRRRLRSALAEVAPRHAAPDMDYVIVARTGAATVSFDALVKHLITAFEKIRSRTSQQQRARAGSTRQGRLAAGTTAPTTSNDDRERASCPGKSNDNQAP